MTLNVLPSMPGLSWPLTRSPIWKTGIQPTQSGRELRAAFMSYPLYKWTATYDILRSATAFQEFQQLMGFFNQCSGAFQQFLFTDPDDNAVTAQQIGTGDGHTVTFTVPKSFGGYFAEPVGYIVPSGISVFVNGILQSATFYTLNSPVNGQITFAGNAIPPNGQAITWTGSYQYVCRFLTDTYDFDRFMNQLYSTKKIEWQSTKP